MREPLNVLVTGAGAPGFSGTLYSLLNNYDNRKLNIYAADADKNAYGRYLDGVKDFIEIPHASNGTCLSLNIISLCDSLRLHVVLPQVEDELMIFSYFKKIAKEYNNVNIIVSDLKQLNIAQNKNTLYSIADELYIPVPERTVATTWDEVVFFAQKIGFPKNKFVIKPIKQSGMRGLRIVSDIMNKEEFLSSKPVYANITLSGLHKVLGDSFPEMLVTEYLPGDEYSVDVLSDCDKTIITIPRKRDVIRTGITFAGTIVKNDDLIKYSEKLTKRLCLSYAHGYQFKKDKGGTLKLLECNPRIQGTMVASTFAGANIIYGAVKLAIGEKPKIGKVKWGMKYYRTWGGLGVYDDEKKHFH